MTVDYLESIATRPGQFEALQASGDRAIERVLAFLPEAYAKDAIEKTYVELFGAEWIEHGVTPEEVRSLRFRLSQTYLSVLFSQLWEIAPEGGVTLFLDPYLLLSLPTDRSEGDNAPERPYGVLAAHVDEERGRLCVREFVGNIKSYVASEPEGLCVDEYQGIFLRKEGGRFTLHAERKKT